jgi:Arc/MetJ family transcription regulator
MANVRRTSINLDFELVERAQHALGTKGTTETIHRALEDVTYRAAAQRMAAWRFDHMEPDWLEKLRSGEHHVPDEKEHSGE